MPVEYSSPTTDYSLSTIEQNDRRTAGSLSKAPAMPRRPRMAESGSITDYEKMLGTSAAIRTVFDLIGKVAKTDIPVLISGETGTGRELTARAIHARSRQKLGPFVLINCSAIPETLLESELFGQEHDAFTDAIQHKKGKIEAAAGGTLFLNELGDLRPSLQVKLLRLLQNRPCERISSHHMLPTRARIIAATNVDLKVAIDKRRFREDLYNRLGMLRIHLPLLRERGEAAALMATRFLEQA